MVAAPPTEALVVFALVAAAVAAFVTEVVPADVTAISVVVALVVLERGQLEARQKFTTLGQGKVVGRR